MKNIFKSNIRNLASRIVSGKFRGTDGLSKRIITLESVISSKIKSINGLIFRKGGRGLIGILLEYIRGVRPRSSKSVVRQVAGFVFFISKMARHSGLKGVVIYLKACQVLLQQVVGGFRVLDLSELKVRPARNRAGVPLIIPAGVRVKISHDRDKPTIRFWMTLFGLYRILEFRGKLSLDTITDKGPNLSKFLPGWEKFLREVFIPGLHEKVGEFPEVEKPRFFPILKTGPNSGPVLVNSSAPAMIISARLWLKCKHLVRYLTEYTTQIGIPAFVSRLRLVAMAQQKGDFKGLGGEDLKSATYYAEETPYPMGDAFLGKLGFKVEPAGKVRVFAMVDAWTQWLMYPLHKFLFLILRGLDVDGTFDQMAPIKRLQEQFSRDPRGRMYASIDLSSATDRLPLALQISLIKELFKDKVPDSEAFAKAWASLLVKRFYQVKMNPHLLQQTFVPKKYNVHPDFGAFGVTYSVGQPMGALSSWAMLALTHHAIVQFASFKAYKGKRGWFEDYGVLGDDVVIIGAPVVLAYRRILQEIGVKAGLAKSIVAKSKFVLEFAKKFFVDSGQANMLPLKECIATRCSTSLVVEFVRKYDLTLNAILSFLGYGYKTKMKVFKTNYFKLRTRLRVLLIWLSHPSSPMGRGSYTSWITQVSWTDHYMPSYPTLLKMTRLTEELMWDKLEKAKKDLNGYISTIRNADSVLNRKNPIEVTALVSSGSSDLTLSKQKVPWKAILNPDMTTAPAMEYEFLTEGMSVHSYRYQQLQKVSLFPDYNKLSLGYATRNMMMCDFSSLPLTEQIEVNLKFLFEPDPINPHLPESFWEESKKADKPFKDFLEIYRIWQHLTVPLWQELNGVDPLKVKAAPPQETQTYPDRGDLEGSATTSVTQSVTQRVWYIDRFYQFINIITWLVELGIFWLGLFILFNIEPDASGSVIPEISSESEPAPSQDINYLAWGLMLLGGAILLTSMALSIYYTGDISSAFYNSGVPEIVISSDSLNIQTSSLGVSGPLTLSEYEVLQRTLENKALLDNLSISPIGDLWVSPWE